MKPFDYIGLLGQDQKKLDPVAKAAWDQLRDAMVFGAYQWVPPVGCETKRKLFRWQQIVTGFGGQRVLLDNLPKGLGKTGYEMKEHQRDTLWQTAEKMALHGYMGYPRPTLGLDELAARIRGKTPRYRTISTPIQGAGSELLEKIKRRNWEQAYNPYEDLTPTGRIKPEFQPVMPILSGGLRRGQLALESFYMDRLPIDPLIRFKHRPFGGHVEAVFDFEADMNLEESFTKLYEHIKSRPMKEDAFFFDSLSQFKVLDEANLYRGPKGEWVSYTYDPDDWLSKLYAAEREKKFDHKAAVSRVLKRNKFHDKKGTARRLEFIGAGYEEHKKALKAPKSEWGPADLKQISGRVKRVNPQ
uniref:Uncharacterized protein n=1 Tax=Pseudomonas phage HRDY3 TaxID=3236930 RepID=A0AB39CDI5_9VIRU